MTPARRHTAGLSSAGPYGQAKIVETQFKLFGATRRGYTAWCASPGPPPPAAHRGGPGGLGHIQVRTRTTVMGTVC